MGRIEEALKRAKESHVKSGVQAPHSQKSSSNLEAPKRLTTIGERDITLLPVFQDLQKSATYHELDKSFLQKHRVITDKQSLAVRSAYKMLRTRLLQRMRANNWTTLAISSARSSAGKTLTAINTSISIANDPNQRVILVDLDLRRPSVARYLGIEHEFSLTDYLLRNKPIEDVVVKTSIERLLVIPNLESHESSSELLSSLPMLSLVERLSSDVEDAIVIFDLPPMLDADDMLAFSPYVDALLFIVAECETRRADLKQVSDLIEDLNVVGVILNKSDDESPAYY
jgi:Mrp family chromosome partitioning ATPase